MPPTTPTPEFIAELLRQSPRSYAAQAASDLIERDRAIAAAWGSSAFARWRDLLGQLVSDLATALDFEEPEIFAVQLRWNREAFEAREAPLHHLRRGVEALRDVLAEELPDGGGDLSTRIIDQAVGSIDQPAPGRHGVDARSEQGKLTLRFMEAAIAGRRSDAIGVVVDAVKGGMTLTDAYERVLLPAEAEIGRMWHLGELNVPEEHIATETTRSAMSVLSHVYGASDGSKGRVLVASAEGDRHDVGPRAVSDLLHAAGWRAISLGADVPVEDLGRAAAEYEPDLMVLAATVSSHLPKARAGVREVRRHRPNVRVIVGGGGFLGMPSLAEKAGADALASTPSDAVRLADELLSNGGGGDAPG